MKERFFKELKIRQDIIDSVTTLDLYTKETLKPVPHLRTNLLPTLLATRFRVWAGSNRRTKQCWQQCFVKMFSDVGAALELILYTFSPNHFSRIVRGVSAPLPKVS